MDLLNETTLLKTKNTLFNLLKRETSQFLCYERLLVAYKNAFFREMQFSSHCYTVVSYQALFRLSVYKIPAVYLSGAKNACFARYATLVPRLKTVYQSRTNDEFYNILAREFVFSEKYCYWHVTKEENGRKKVEMCGDLSQDPLLAKLTAHLTYFASSMLRCFEITLYVCRKMANFKSI